MKKALSKPKFLKNNLMFLSQDMNKAKEYAEIVASTVLAGELSLVGAIAAGHLARAHQQHGRG